MPGHVASHRRISRHFFVVWYGYLVAALTLNRHRGHQLGVVEIEVRVVRRLVDVNIAVYSFEGEIHSRVSLEPRFVGFYDLAWLLWYIQSRLHSTLNYVSPMQFEQHWLADQAKRTRS